jgi:hypothetical protein
MISNISFHLKMIDMIWLKLFVCCFVCLRLDFAFAADKPLPPKLQFDYAVSVTVDYKQREAYLKKNNESPQAYDAALKMMTGGLHAADITDIVEIGPAKYQINSTANLTSVLGAVIPNQTLYRLSYGDVTKDGLVTTSYVEKKGSAEQYQAKLDLRTKKVLFSKDRSKTGSADLNGNLLDLLNVAYTYLGRSPPAAQSLLNITDSKSLARYTLNRGESWDFPFNGSKIKAYRYFKSVTKDDSSTLQIWLSEKGNIPLRIVVGLNERYGATIQADLKALPPL